jgi:serine/threonine-protein kinase
VNWQAHGSYLIKGLDDPVEIFEVGERGLAPIVTPPSGGNAQRSVSAEEEATLGWRPAKGLEVPRRVGWRLETVLGEGGFGEVWLAENCHTSQRRVFKFCF